MEKRRREYLFLAAGLVVLLIALYFTFKPGAPAARATTAPAPGSQTAAQPSPEPSAAVEPVEPLAAGTSPTTPGRNPFTPVIALRPAAAPQASPPPMTTPMARALPPIQPLPLPFGDFGGAPQAQQPSSGVIAPPPGPPAEPPLQLTGVIYGDPSIAIIRKGDKRYYVRPGDPVGSRYVVQSISHRRVVLASSEGTLSLDLTGRL